MGEYGAPAESWRKMKIETNVVREADNAVIRRELHWYEGIDHDGRVIRVEIKPK